MSNTKPTDKIYLLHKDGRRWEFTDIYNAAKTLKEWGFYNSYGWNRSLIQIDDHYHSYGHWDSDRGEHVIDGYIEYILRSEFGDIITCADLDIAWDAIRTAARDKRLDKAYNEAVKNFRCAPAPHTRCQRGGNHYYRRIHTFPEHRDNEALYYDEDTIEYNIQPRGRRRGHNLPNSWDDIYRGNGTNKNWKNARKTQWRKKK